ncbi:MAG TPA: TspO/MBR family protein [Candidatus Babeliales bacterium]|jgi:tryptophan-rich sensory protein|nr:TspO/MBR family protein [Candidatus Babeliales bacterium]
MKIEMRFNWVIIPSVAIGIMIISRLLMLHQWQWYLSLSLPRIMPSNLVIRGMWQLIYVCTTGCALIIYNLAERNRRFWVVMSLLCITTALNIYWLYLFFNQHMLGWSTLCALVLSAMLWLLIYAVRPVSFFCVFLLLPYALWITFETVLNLWICLIN